jgi:GntR family transcriptional regulator/MocR family aminotransferase
VIEDDYDGEFRYDRLPVGALQALDPDRVIYAGTASKSLAPALRLGWLVLPEALLEAVTESPVLHGRPAGVIEQLTLAEFLRSSDYDRQVRSRRLAYRRRRDLLVHGVRRAAPAITVTGIAAGLHAVLRLPDGVDEEKVTAAASARGVDVDCLSGFAAPGLPRGSAASPALVVGYGTPSDHAFPDALARLCAVLARTGGS